MWIEKLETKEAKVKRGRGKDRVYLFALRTRDLRKLLAKRRHVDTLVKLLLTKHRLVLK